MALSDARTFVVRSSEQRHGVVLWLNTLEVDETHALEIVVRRYKARRNLAQNARYWAILHHIAQQTGHTADELHEHCKAKFIGVHRYEVLGRVIEVPMSSTELNTAEFADYSTRVEEWAISEFDLTLPYYSDWYESGHEVVG